MTGSISVRSEHAGDLDVAEARAWADFHRAADDDLAASCGVGALEIGSAFLGSAAKIDVLTFNRAIGLGLDHPTSEQAIDLVIEHYAHAGVPRFLVHVHPLAAQAGLPALLESRGLTHYNNWVKLQRGVEALPDVATDLRVVEIEADRAESFATILVTSFDWPKPVTPWVARSVGRPSWRHYLALDGEAPVATGAFFAHGEDAWFDMASTLEGYRGRGAQKALIARRIDDARAMGCTRLVVETAEETSDRRAHAFRNVRRLGFEVAYVRPNYIYAPAPPNTGGP